VNKNFLRTTQDLWLHDLYIEAHDGSAQDVSPATTLVEVSRADLWITKSVLVGDLTGRASRAVHVTDRGRLYSRGATSTSTSYWLLLYHVLIA
jgi:hypothetical protein